MPRERILFDKTMMESNRFDSRCPNLLRKSLRALRMVLVLWAVTFVTHASAAENDAEQLEAIRSQMDEGQGLFLAKKYEEAAAVFEKGFQRYPYSAFLFNAGVCYQRIGAADKALDAFRRYLKSDPNAPDTAAVKERMAKIEAAIRKAEEASEGQEGEKKVELPTDDTQMKSLVLIYTEPAGAQVQVYRRKEDYAPAYTEGAKNSLWELVADNPSPLNLTLDVGRYHVVIEKFEDFNGSQADIDVVSGRVHHFQANLAQGEFMGFVEIGSNVKGARIYLDDDIKQKDAIWGEAPHGALVAPGKHRFLLEAPGYEPATLELAINTGDKQEHDVQMMRVNFGVVRLDADAGEVTVSVDQKPVGVWRAGQSALELELLAGKHDFTVTANGYKTLRKSVNVPKGQILPVRAKMIRRVPRGAAWTQAVFSAAFLGAGIYFGVESNRLNKDLKADRDAGYLNPRDPRINQGMWYSIGANSAFALSGLFGALSIWNFVKDPHPDPKLYLGKEREFKKMRTPPSTAQSSFRWQVGFTPMPQLGEVH